MQERLKEFIYPMLQLEYDSYIGMDDLTMDELRQLKEIVDAAINALLAPPNQPLHRTD